MVKKVVLMSRLDVFCGSFVGKLEMMRRGNKRVELGKVLTGLSEP